MSQRTSFDFIQPLPFQPCVIYLCDNDHNVIQEAIRIYNPNLPQEFIASKFWAPLFEEDIVHWTKVAVATATELKKYMEDFTKRSGVVPKPPKMDFSQIKDKKV